MIGLKLTQRIRTGAVVRAVPGFEQVLRHERQFNLLRVINELPRAKSRPWWTVCRVAGLTELEIRLLNDVLREAAEQPHRAA